MTNDEAIDFLQLHQPMSPTASQDEQVIKKLDEVRQRLVAIPDVRAIPLLLNVFGEGDGFGVYQLIEDALKVHQPDIVVPHIRQALSSPHVSVRTWCAEIACCFPDISYKPFLQRMMTSSDEDERDAANECLTVLQMQRSS